MKLRLPRPLWIALATVVMVVMAVGVHFGMPLYRQHVAIREIERLGGTVYMPEDGPQWLRDRVGDEWMRLFDTVAAVGLSETEITDADLVQLTALTNLKELDLYETRLTDDGLRHLKTLTKLEQLSLHHTQVTDAGLVHLKGLTNLQDLNLDGTHVTSEGLHQLKALTKLQTLWLNDTHVTDAGLMRLSALTNLQTLWLDDTQVTDAGLAHLKGMTNLHELHVDRTQVTDAGLEHLKGLTSLEWLGAKGTDVTYEGAMALHAALPRCAIDVGALEAIAALRKAGALVWFKPAPQNDNVEKDKSEQRESVVVVVGARWTRWKGNDEELKLTRKLPSPVALYVIGTEHVSDASLDALRKALPTVKIERRSEALFGVDVAKHPQGVEIVNVLPGSPADRAGIRSGDVLVEFAGEAVPSSDSLQRVMLPLKAGQKVTAKLERGSQTLSVVVLLEEWN